MITLTLSSKTSENKSGFLPDVSAPGSPFCWLPGSSNLDPPMWSETPWIQDSGWWGLQPGASHSHFQGWNGKHLLEGIQHETSQTCHQLGIPCLQTDANGQSPIIDVWDRQHLSERLERVHPNEAAIFMATFQLEARGLETAMQTSGEGGHYLEPRTPDGRSPDPEYRVIWLPKATKQSAILASQSTQQWNCVVRSGNRFGLRVKIEAAATVHTQHKPHTPFLDSDKILTFHAGPFPHGSQPSSTPETVWPVAMGSQTMPTTQSCSQWIRGDLGSTSHQPTPVWGLPESRVSKTVDIQGSAKTIAALTAPVENDHVDPWIKDDP